MLRRIVTEDPSDRVREKAIFGLSVSKEPEAVPAMIDAAKNDRSSHVRGQALFWLAHKAGQKAAVAITEAIENDPDTEVKKKAVFALQQLPADEGVPLLIRRGPNEQEPRGPQTGDVLARADERPAGAAVLRGSAAAISEFLGNLYTGRCVTPRQWR